MEIAEEKPAQPQGHIANKEKQLKKPIKNSNRKAKREIILRSSAAEEEVKLAAISISFNIRLKSSDMPIPMQEHALRLARSFADSAPKHNLNNTHFARTLKKEFDSFYGPAWHCVVGKSFGSFVTYSPGAFIYFSLDSISILLFQTEVQLVTQPKP